MTTSANIPDIVSPFVSGNWQNRAWPYGKKKIYTMDEFRPRKRGKGQPFMYGQTGMLYVTNSGQISEAYTTLVDKKKGIWKLNKTGKMGHWRTVKGKRYFFPLDGSGPIPPVPGSKKGSGGGGGGASQQKAVAAIKKKKGLLAKLLDKIDPTKVKVRDAGPTKQDQMAARKAADGPAQDGWPGGKGKGKSGDKGGSGGGGGRDVAKEVEGMAKKVDDMLAKAKGSKNKGATKALKKMQKALDSGDPKAFQKASQALAKQAGKMRKKARKK